MKSKRYSGKSTLAFVATLVTIMALLNACGPLNDLKETKETTRKMAETTATMKTTTERTYEAVDYGTIAGRIRESSAARDEAKTELREHKSLPLNEKLLVAAKLIKSFDFQIHRGFGLDDPSQLDLHYRDAIKEFQKILSTEIAPALALLPQDLRSPANLSSLDPNLENVRALAGALHEVNPFQEMRQRRDGVKPVTLAELIYSGLRKSAASMSGSAGSAPLALYEQIIVREVDQFELLVRVRGDMLAATAFGLYKSAIKKSVDATGAPQLSINGEGVRAAAGVLGWSLEAFTALEQSGLPSSLSAQLAPSAREIIASQVSNDVIRNPETRILLGAFQLRMHALEKRIPANTP